MTADQIDLVLVASFAGAVLATLVMLVLDVMDRISRDD